MTFVRLPPVMSKTASITVRVRPDDKARFEKLSEDTGLPQGDCLGRLLDLAEPQLRYALPPRKVERSPVTRRRTGS